MRTQAGSLVHRTIVAGLAIAMLSTVSSSASAQFGLFKKGKHKADSTAHDSTTVSNGSIASDSAAAAADTAKKHRSFFAKALSAAGKANNAVQEKTGIDTKALALDVATGGMSSMVGKAQAAAAAANGGGASAASAIGQSLGSHKLPFGAKLGVATALTALTPHIGSAVAGAPSAMTASASPNADQRDVMAFQQEMLDVQSKAANGDAGARARLEQWQAISVKYQPQMTEATQRASAGDQKAVKQLSDLQIKMIREWRAGGSSSSSKP